MNRFNACWCLLVVVLTWFGSGCWLVPNDVWPRYNKVDEEAIPEPIAAIVDKFRSEATVIDVGTFQSGPGDVLVYFIRVERDGKVVSYAYDRGGKFLGDTSR